MHASVKFAHDHILRVLVLLGMVSFATMARAEDAILGFVRDTVGTWTVQQQTWPSAGAEPITLAPATAQRRLIGTFLEELVYDAESVIGRVGE